MDEPVGTPRKSTAWIADSGLFIACGRTLNNKYVALKRFAQRNQITLIIPERVYSELVNAPNSTTPAQTPINRAISSGWVQLAEEIDYANPLVSGVMDGVRRYIAQASNRSEHMIKKTDTALGGVAIQLLFDGEAEYVYVITTDIQAGKAVERIVQAHGFDGQIEFVNGFELIDSITQDFIG